MGFFKRDDTPGTGLRLTGWARFTEIVTRDFARFFLLNLLTILGLTPFILGMVYAMNEGSLVLIPFAAIIGGAIGGPFLVAMIDTIFRSLRDAPGGIMENYKKAWKQDWKASVVPGIFFFLFMAFYICLIFLYLLAGIPVNTVVLVIAFIGLLVITMFFTCLWPQIAIFTLTPGQMVKNCFIFNIHNMWKLLALAFLQIGYWLAIAALIPYTLLIVGVFGFWFIFFLVYFFLYKEFNTEFRIEERIAEAHPEQAAFYETDEEWLKRKQQEELEESAKKEEQK
ncbi:MAG: hypothetical protein U0L49_06510 [Eubacterium sp.]|nr:hypothetical protein [Eubacterium sp.]